VKYLAAKEMKTVMAGALGECVHVGGVMNFLRLVEIPARRTVFLGPAVSVEESIAAAERERADLVGVSYQHWVQFLMMMTFGTGRIWWHAILVPC
jgi:hypothetical protein